MANRNLPAEGEIPFRRDRSLKEIVLFDDEGDHELALRPDAYEPGHFHRVHIGEVYSHKYKVLRKLGIGMHSTVWLVEDVEPTSDRYLAMKVLSAECWDRYGESIELQILRQLDRADPEHPGFQFVPHIKDHFVHAGPHFKHMCLLFDVMGETMRENMWWLPGGAYHLGLLKLYFKQLLYGLDYAHSNDVIHTDINMCNIMFQIHDPACIGAYLQRTAEELTAISPNDAEGNTTWHTIPTEKIPPQSLSLYHLGSAQKYSFLGLKVCLIDWGSAILNGSPRWADPGPEHFRAPEVLTGAPWDEKIDIWALGLQLTDFTWDPGQMVTGCGPDQSELYFPDYCHPKYHFNEIRSILGDFPRSLLDKGDPKIVQHYFNEGGKLRWFHQFRKSNGPEIWSCNASGKEKPSWLSIWHKMLKLDPQDRKSAKELLEEPWIKVTYCLSDPDMDNAGDFIMVKDPAGADPEAVIQQEIDGILKDDRFDSLARKAGVAGLKQGRQQQEARRADALPPTSASSQAKRDMNSLAVGLGKVGISSSSPFAQNNQKKYDPVEVIREKGVLIVEWDKEKKAWVHKFPSENIDPDDILQCSPLESDSDETDLDE